MALTRILEKNGIATPLLRRIPVNVTLLFLIMHILHAIFCAISFNRSRDITILRNLEKNTIAVPFSKLCPQKLYQCHPEYKYTANNFF